MRETALGMIETWGLVAAVAAADAALKAAPIQLLGTRTVGDGLVTVVMSGSVAATQIAVETGADSARRVGRVHSTRVIARPYPPVWETVDM